jgi:hypothetical protein
MTDSKTDRLPGFSKLARAASGEPPAQAKSSRFARPIDTDRLEGSLAGSAAAARPEARPRARSRPSHAASPNARR